MVFIYKNYRFIAVFVDAHDACAAPGFFRRRYRSHRSLVAKAPGNHCHLYLPQQNGNERRKHGKAEVNLSSVKLIESFTVDGFDQTGFIGGGYIDGAADGVRCHRLSRIRHRLSSGCRI